MTEHKFRIPIGDWSGDGHEKCDWFTVKSNKPVEEVRETHYRSRELFDIEALCHRHESGTVTPEQVEQIKACGLDPEKYFSIWREDTGETIIEETEDMANLWLDLLMRADPELHLEIIQEEPLPMLPFYGFDEKGRHIGHIGYGLFYYC